MKIDYRISDVAPYINWIYFYHAWGVSQRPDDEKLQLRREAEERLARHADRFQTHALFRLLDVYSLDDDIMVRLDAADADHPDGLLRLPMLRQQTGDRCLCLADFVSPAADRMGVFAATVDAAMEQAFADDPYESLMMKLLADRLAEATAERLHEQVRTDAALWGYAPGERLAMADLHAERWQGIRPAVGYPSMPDQSVNFLLDRLLSFRQIGISITESGAMRPHASVSGLMMAHPQARYFSVGKIGPDQLADYARRRGLSMQQARRFLAANL